MNVINLWLGKMGTIFSDRRALTYIASVILTLLAVPYTADNVDNTTIAAIVLVIQGAVILLGQSGLIKSWENRPPSGLKYKEVLQAFLEGDSEEMQALRELLEEAGIHLGDG